MFLEGLTSILAPRISNASSVLMTVQSLQGMQSTIAQGPTPLKSLSVPFLALSFLLDTELYQNVSIQCPWTTTKFWWSASYFHVLWFLNNTHMDRVWMLTQIRISQVGNTWNSKESCKLQKQLESPCTLWERHPLAQFHMETRWVGKTIEFKCKGGWWEVNRELRVEC